MEIYISREKLLDSFRRSANDCRDWKAQATDEEIKARADAALATWIECIMRTEQQPAADVEEVRHGEWIKKRTNVYECSVCKRTEVLEGAIVNADNESKLLRAFFPYCHCGAKMDGGKE